MFILFYPNYTSYLQFDKHNCSKYLFPFTPKFRYIMPGSFFRELNLTGMRMLSRQVFNILDIIVETMKRKLCYELLDELLSSNYVKTLLA
eukprot:snap_masked-scaffold_61-processed-gene-0.49-mRNA-1 protein AED:1.00 eAED:1.00 QI:0/0/0/0/1/1/4/0/89